MDNPFLFDVVDYNFETKEYTLRNKRTGEIKHITKDEYAYYSGRAKKKTGKTKR
jgi:hypothetical protein